VYDLPRQAFESSGDASPAPDPAAPADPARDPFWPAVRVHAGEALYDYCWYSRASAADPPSCCFATAARAHPVHLWDACSGDLRCSYRPYNALDELAPAYCVAFDPEGGALLAGGRAAIYMFDVHRPGREHTTLATHRRGQEGQPGIVSCLAFAPGGGGATMAAGAYSGVAALYDARSREQLLVLEGHAGGVTHLRFSADGNYLYTGARRDAALLCWDVRHASGAVYALRRATAATNQRVAFDIEPAGRHLASGGEDGCVRVYDLRDGAEVAAHRVAGDTVTGCEFHPYLPLLATASGHRRLYLAPSDSSGSVSGSESESGGGGAASGMEEGGQPEAPAAARRGGPGGLTRDENVLRVWRFAASPAEAAPVAEAEELAGGEAPAPTTMAGLPEVSVDAALQQIPIAE
jgi:hypothetical protein